MLCQIMPDLQPAVALLGIMVGLSIPYCANGLVESFNKYLQRRSSLEEQSREVQVRAHAGMQAP